MRGVVEAGADDGGGSDFFFLPESWGMTARLCNWLLNKRASLMAAADVTSRFKPG